MKKKYEELERKAQEKQVEIEQKNKSISQMEAALVAK